MRTYRLASIGLGRMGSTIDQEVLDYPPVTLPYSVAASCQASERLELVAGADLLTEKRKAFQEKWGTQALYEDFIEMIDKESPDVVAICTKGDNHAELTIKVAESGVPMIFCEKAMGCSMAEADAARDAVRKSGAKYVTGVLHRWGAPYQDLRRRIEAGEIGVPTHAVQYGQRTLLHGHVHSVSTLMYFLGDPNAVSVWGELLPRDLEFENGRLDKDPTAVYQIEFDNGTAAYHVPAGHHDFEVYGTEGVFRLANNGVHLSIRKALDEGGRFKPFMETTLPPPAGPRSATVNMLEDLIGAHEENRPTLCDIDRTHHGMEILFAIAECHQLRAQRVQLPVTNRERYIFHV